MTSWISKIFVLIWVALFLMAMLLIGNHFVQIPAWVILAPLLIAILLLLLAMYLKLEHIAATQFHKKSHDLSTTRRKKNRKP